MRNTKTTLPNGLTSDFSYNQNSWLTNIAGPAFSAGYQFDRVGNITQKANDVTTGYGYDKTYQLLNSSNTLNSETFTYDKVGNRKTKQNTTQPWSYNKNNELLNAESAAYTYDNNGNTVTKAENGQTTTFSYNATDRLTSVQLPDGRTATYTYDPFGRRVRKQVGQETTIFVYADEGLIGEYTQQGTAIKTYGWRPNSIWGTNPLFQVDNGNYYFYHNDHMGTPQTMTDAAGDIVWEATYEAFGKAVVDADTTITNNLRFPGQYWDEESGLHWNWQRYYDPASGRYTKVDPIGFRSGDKNLYRYVENNPFVLFDPYGLAENQHHPIVQQAWRGIKKDLKPEVKSYLERNTIDAGKHTFANPHSELNKLVVSKWAEFFKDINPSDISLKDINRFEESLKVNPDYVRLNSEIVRIGRAKCPKILNVAGYLLMLIDAIDAKNRANKYGVSPYTIMMYDLLGIPISDDTFKPPSI